VSGSQAYRVALLSNAMHQERFAQAFGRHPRLSLAVLVDEPDVEPYVARRNRALAAEHGLPYRESLDAAADMEIDVVSVGAEIERRGRLATAAARWSKHLWLDKPPVSSVAEADELAAAVAAHGVKSLVFSHLAAPWSAALQAAIAGGELGALRAVHMDFSFVKGSATGLSERRVPAGTGARDVWTFRDAEAATDPTESGHNVIAKRELAEEGWYALSLAWRLCPQPVQRVYATGGAYFLEHHRDLNVEDFATLVLTLRDGPLVTIATGRTGRRTHAGTSRMSVRAVGDRATIVVDGGQPAVYTYSGDGGGGGRSRPAAESTGLAELVDRFVAYLDGEATSPTTVEDARGLMRVLDAAYESFAVGQPVDCR
jgi:predicted dehydrogenase